jgi:hypothetical protein
MAITARAIIGAGPGTTVTIETKKARQVRAFLLCAIDHYPLKLRRFSQACSLRRYRMLVDGAAIDLQTRAGLQRRQEIFCLESLSMRCFPSILRHLPYELFRRLQ